MTKVYELIPKVQASTQVTVNRYDVGMVAFDIGDLCNKGKDKFAGQEYNKSADGSVNWNVQIHGDNC